MLRNGKNALFEPFFHDYDRMHEKMQTPYAKMISRIRSRMVEPVLGTLLNFLNMRRVNTRGIQLATKHVMMAALCYNLKKYLRFTSNKAEKIATVKELVQREADFMVSTLFSAFVRPVFLFPATIPFGISPWEPKSK
jgi:hypothetical protein